MGSGKSTIGKMLAGQIGFKFLDLDAYIEQQQGKTISDIFEESGELGFRKIERQALLNFQNVNNVVVAAGGGTPCFEDNMERINEMGFSIYIKLSPEYLSKRLYKAKSKRPLIAQKSDEELLAFITGMLKEREPFYNKAKYISFNTTQTPCQTCEEILNML